MSIVSFGRDREHCVLQTHWKQRRASKMRFCEWRGVNVSCSERKLCGAKPQS